MTEANACHNKVSIAAMATLLVSAPGSLMEEIDWVNLSQRLTSYLTLFHPFVISICENIGRCNSIGGPHPSFEWSVEQLQLLRNCNNCFEIALTKYLTCIRALKASPTSLAYPRYLRGVSLKHTLVNANFSHASWGLEWFETTPL